MIIASVVIKKNNKWFLGFIDGKKLIEKKPIKKLSDIKKETTYRGLSAYLKLNKYKLTEEQILKKLKVDKIYVLKNPIGLEAKELEKWMWMDYNKKCKKCIKNCKQSHRVNLVSCKGYKSI